MQMVISAEPVNEIKRMLYTPTLLAKIYVYPYQKQKLLFLEMVKYEI